MSPSEDEIGDELFERGRAPFALTTLGDAALATWFNRRTAARPGTAIRRVRGRLARATRELWNEASAALQFPYYFTVGWPGFSDAVRDLAWLPAEGYLLVVGDAPQLFADDPAERDTEWAELVRVLARAHAYWEQVHVDDASQPAPVPFRVLLQCTPDTVEDVIARIEGAGAGVARWSPEPDG